MDFVVEFFKWVGAAIGSALAIYTAARLVTAAAYQSKMDYERTKYGSQRPKQPRSR